MCLDPVRAVAQKICSQTALTPVTWTSQRKYKHKCWKYILDESLFLGFFCQEVVIVVVDRTWVELGLFGDMDPNQAVI